MSKTSRREYTEAMKMRYQQKRGKRAKSRLLDEYCEVTGHERRYANKLMLGIKGPGRGRPKKAGRRSTYGPEVMKVLKRLWFLAEQACGKRLAPVLPLWMGAYEKRYGRLGKGLKEKVLKELTPVRAEAWDVEEPRWIEADIVGTGEARRSAVSSGRLAARTSTADGPRSERRVKRGNTRFAGRLPFEIKGVDTDNGPEFLNWHFRAYFKEREREVELTR